LSNKWGDIIDKSLGKTIGFIGWVAKDSWPGTSDLWSGSMGPKNPHIFNSLTWKIIWKITIFNKASLVGGLEHGFYFSPPAR
jgi:hypothetical protein